MLSAWSKLGLGLTGRDRGSVEYLTAAATEADNEVADAFLCGRGDPVTGGNSSTLFRSRRAPQNDVSTSIRCGEGDRIERLLPNSVADKERSGVAVLPVAGGGAGLTGRDRGSVAYLIMAAERSPALD